MVKVTVVGTGTYSWKMGLWKTVKNALVFLLPSLVAYQASVPAEWAPLVGMLVYFIKNYIENK